LSDRFCVPGSEFQVSGSWFRVHGFGFMGSGSWFRFHGFGFMVSGSASCPFSTLTSFGFRVWGLRARLCSMQGAARGGGGRCLQRVVAASCQNAKVHSTVQGLASSHVLTPVPQGIAGDCRQGLESCLGSDFSPFMELQARLEARHIHELPFPSEERTT